VTDEIDSRGELLDHLASELAVAPLTAVEIDALLDLAGAAAHGTGERTSAPLTTFLAGLAAAAATDRMACIEKLRALTDGITSGS
jgi:hypothetical protein